MKDIKDDRQNHSVPPIPVTTINVRDEHGNKRSKQVSAFKENQDRSCFRPHQGKKEKAKRLKRKEKSSA